MTTQTLHVPESTLFPPLNDAHMDSMRLLSETAAQYPDAISFSSGAPYDEHYSFQDVHDLLESYVERSRSSGDSEKSIKARIFHYSNVNGFIVNEVARYLARHEETQVEPDAIVITNGFQEALMITLRALHVDSRDVLLTADPSYVGVRGAASMLELPVVGVRQGRDGIDPEDVASCAARLHSEGRRVVGLYVNPDNSNPAGKTMALEQRQALIAVAGRYGFFILEDNPYRVFSHPDRLLPTLKSLDEGGVVIGLGSFAKSVFPGARLGYVVADQEVYGGDGGVKYLAKRMTPIKSMFSVGTSSLSQALVAAALESADYDLGGRIAAARRAYHERLEATLTSVAKHFPASDVTTHRVTWDEPDGGFFMVLHTGFEADLAHLRLCVERFGVSWAPMDIFYLDDSGRRSLRLGFSNLGPELIDEGIERLASFNRCVLDGSVQVQV